MWAQTSYCFEVQNYNTKNCVSWWLLVHLPRAVISISKHLTSWGEQQSVIQVCGCWKCPYKCWYCWSCTLCYGADNGANNDGARMCSISKLNFAAQFHMWQINYYWNNLTVLIYLMCRCIATTQHHLNLVTKQIKTIGAQDLLCGY